MRKQKVLLPGYTYVYNPWYGFYPYYTWQEWELEY